MLNFGSVRRNERTMNDFAAPFTRDDLRHFTNTSIGHLLALLDDCMDDAVTFVPNDPDADDAAAENSADRHLPWTLGHVIAHMTASGEEYAAVATEFARGVPFHGRPRYETPWQEMNTIAQCRARIAESRRMRIASLEMWPDLPHFDNGTVYWEGSGWVNANGIFVWGLAHDDDHIQQAVRIIAQAKAARM